MPNHSISAHWDKVIAELEVRLEKAKAVRDALNDPELAGEIAKSLGVQPASRPARRRGKNRLTHIQKIERFFQENNNKWADSFEISAGTGVKRDAIRQVIYKTAIDRLVKQRDPKGSSRVKFRLKLPETDE
jgi:hypothetical protein